MAAVFAECIGKRRGLVAFARAAPYDFSLRAHSGFGVQNCMLMTRTSTLMTRAACDTNANVDDLVFLIDHMLRSLHPERRCAEECCQDISGFRAREHVRAHHSMQVVATSQLHNSATSVKRVAALMHACHVNSDVARYMQQVIRANGK
jgi:hypothetical protein